MIFRGGRFPPFFLRLINMRPIGQLWIPLPNETIKPFSSGDGGGRSSRLEPLFTEPIQESPARTFHTNPPAIANKETLQKLCSALGVKHDKDDTVNVLLEKLKNKFGDKFNNSV